MYAITILSQSVFFKLSFMMRLSVLEICLNLWCLGITNTSRCSLSLSVAPRSLSECLSSGACVKEQYLCLDCSILKKVCSPSFWNHAVSVPCIVSVGFFLLLLFMVVLFTLLQFHKLYCGNTANFSERTCIGVHKYINVPYRIKMEAFSWVAQQFAGLGSFIFPRICLLSDFDVLRIIYSSGAFSNCAFLLANNQKLLGFKLFYSPAY